MNDFEDIKQLWNSNNHSDLPDAEQMGSIIKKYQNKKKRTIFLVIALLILCGVLFTLSFIFHRPLLWTTKFGEVLMASGFIFGLIMALNKLKKVSKDELKSNKDYLENSIEVSIQKKSKANWHILISMLLIAAGYGFYIYENIRDNQSALILSYFGIALYILIIYFIFRPFMKNRSKNTTKEMFEEIEKLK